MELEALNVGQKVLLPSNQPLVLILLSVPECLLRQIHHHSTTKKWFLFHHIFIIQTFMSVKLQQILILPNHIMQLAQKYISLPAWKLLTDEVSFQHFPKSHGILIETIVIY